VLEKFEGLTEAEQHIKEAEALQRDIDDYFTLVLLLKDYESKIFDDSDLVRAERYVDKIVQIDEDIAAFNRIQEVISEYTIADANVGLKVAQLEKIKKQYSDMLGQRCPTCFVTIDSKRKKEILEIL
jgi:hypothetical protein